MSQQWWDHLQTFGSRRRHGYVKGHPYPKAHPADGQRLDAWTPDGGMPGSDLDFMRKQHLDAYGVDFGIMNPLGLSGQGDQIARAVGGAVVGHQRLAARSLEPAGAAAEGLDRRALRGRRSLASPKSRSAPATSGSRMCMLLSRTAEALGRPRYWPIYRGRGRTRSADRHSCVRL